MSVTGRVNALLAIIGCSLVLGGCTHTHSTTSSSTSTALLPATSASVVDPRVSAAARVQALPLYHQAEQACSQKQYAQAARLLQRLAATPGLSGEEKSFALQQCNLCLKDAGLPTQPAPVIPASASTPPDVKHPLTAAEADCGPRALLLVCRQLGVSASLDDLRRRAGTTEKGTSMAGLTKAVQSLGLKAEGIQVGREALPTIQMPAIAWVNEHHFIAVLNLNGAGESGTATVHDPNTPNPETLSQERLLRLSTGYLLLVHR